jgi:hypothetical protein
MVQKSFDGQVAISQADGSIEIVALYFELVSLVFDLNHWHTFSLHFCNLVKFGFIKQDKVPHQTPKV